MSDDKHDDLIHDWNDQEPIHGTLQFDDETLRDGLQSPSARDPELDEKIRLVHLMDGLGIQTADVGLPGASAKAREHIKVLCQEMESLKITPNVACRTLISDIAPAVELQQELGSPIEVCMFIGSSAIRQYTEDWEIEKMLSLSREAVQFCTDQGVTSMFVTEDTTRARPETVRALYSTAIEAGAARICICDTCGHATPSGVKALVRFVKDLVEELGADVGIDWHGHNDRGLGLINALTAIEAGADRVDASVAGMGAGAGNCPLEALIACTNRMGIETGMELYPLMDCADKIVRPMQERPVQTDGNALMLGYAGVYSSFLLHTERASERFGVDSRDILMELGERKMVGGQEDMIVDVALDLAKRNP